MAQKRSLVTRTWPQLSRICKFIVEIKRNMFRDNTSYYHHISKIDSFNVILAHGIVINVPSFFPFFDVFKNIINALICH